MTEAHPSIDVRRVTGHIGAEITGVRLGPDLPEPVQQLIKQALHEHKVLFFHGQDHLDDTSQAAFARIINVSVNAVESWEQGARRPREATLKLLTIAHKYPEVLLASE